MIKGNHMTDISKEAVAIGIEKIQERPTTIAEDWLIEKCTGLSARVEEAEESAACWKQQVQSHELYELGRLQGLNEAKAKVEELWAGRTCREVADAIEALKGEATND